MRLGLCYMVFDGEEFLEFAARSVRPEVDHISCTYQTTSYFGNPAGPELAETVRRVQSLGLVDELIHYEPDLRLPPKENEVRLRNIGLAASRRAGCTHHISADVDEFYQPAQLAYAKSVADGYDFTVAPHITYYKDPCYQVVPVQKLVVSLIHPVDNEYTKDVNYPVFPYHMETTRRFGRVDKHRLFTPEELTIHHMSYVRKDIRKKFANSDNARFYKIDKFVADWESHQVGGRVCLLPDYLNRKTRLVKNQFGIQF